MGNSGRFFLRESQLRQSRATKPTVHAGCFSVSIIHRTLTWTTGCLTCAQMLMHAIANGGVRTHVRESALRVDSGSKIPCRIGESTVRQRRNGPMLYQLSYISTPIWCTSLIGGLKGRGAGGGCGWRVFRIIAASMQDHKPKSFLYFSAVIQSIY